jgi:hypothetical protein
MIQVKPMVALSRVVVVGNGILAPGTNAYKATFVAGEGWEIWLDPELSVIHVRKGPFCESIHVTQTKQFRLAALPAFPETQKPIKAKPIKAEALA